MALHYPLSEESIKRLNREFYNTYDTDHWFFKIKTYDLLLENAEEFVEEMGDENLREKSPESFHRAIESEIVFTFYHISESLFMLIGSCDTPAPWLKMKNLRLDEIAEFIRNVVIEKDWGDGQLEHLFYSNLRVPEEHQGTKEDSLEFIEKYLARMSERYLENDIYNEYKHGLRLSTTEGKFWIAPEKEFAGESGPPVLERGGTSHIYLEEEEIHRQDSEVYYQLNRVMSGFDYELFLQLCYINYILIDQIVRVRRRGYGKGDEGRSRVKVNTFHEFDLNEVFNYGPEKEWETSISYPWGDREIKLG